MHKPVNTPFGVVPKRINVCVTFTVIKAFRCWVMLDNKVVPVEYPQCTIWPYFRFHRPEPVVRAGDHVPAIAFFPEPGTYLLEDVPVYQTPGRFGYECYTIPIFGWKRTCCIEAMTRCSRKASVNIHL